MFREWVTKNDQTVYLTYDWPYHNQAPISIGACSPARGDSDCGLTCGLRVSVVEDFSPLASVLATLGPLVLEALPTTLTTQDHVPSNAVAELGLGDVDCKAHRRSP